MFAIHPLSLVLLTGLLAAGCQAPDTRPDPTTIAASVDSVLAEARQQEPAVTPSVVSLAMFKRGEVVGLEHRLKTRTSTIDKYDRLIAENPGTPVDEIILYDALRYTILFEDQPLGHYTAAVREGLRALEEEGYEIYEVKNYWPRGDSYSGVNAVLRTVSGLYWELQFHTVDSYETKSATHDAYERLRATDTPIDEKQRLFDDCTRQWETVRVPVGILAAGAVHPDAEIRVLEAPTVQR